MKINEINFTGIGALVLGLCFAGVACGPRGGEGVGGRVEGAFGLVSVNGQTLPANVSHGSAKVEVRSGTMTFRGDGTCESLTVFVPPSGKPIERTVSASYTLEGGKVEMTWKGAGRTTGVFEGETFTMTNEGMAFVYRR